MTPMSLLRNLYIYIYTHTLVASDVVRGTFCSCFAIGKTDTLHMLHLV